MGKRGKKGKGGRAHREQGRVDYPEIPKQNALFEQYYDQVGIYQPEEKEAFWATLRRELPNSFRFTGSKSHALEVQRLLKEHYIPKITEITHEGQQVHPPEPLPWFPDQLAWQMTTPKNVVRRFRPFAAFQKFLVSETAVGNISRQEAVSMIPPLLLDVQPGMAVLDMCASPGSKAAQLIEMVHGGEEARLRKVIREYNREHGESASPEGEGMQCEMPEESEHGDWSDDGRSTGLLIANDVDWKRAHMLVHQMKRLNSPNLLVSNHDASLFPSIKLHSAQSSNGAPTKARYLKFDRILADVPCSGDGTPRKNYAIWKHWTPTNGIGLHPLQVRILVRSLQMLKVGGRVVYSTCSMHPAENEAVVAAAIDRCGGADIVELVDCSAMLPELKRRQGLTKWGVMGKEGKYWSSWEEVLESKAANGADRLSKLSESIFPPASGTIPLERCMRICAHDQDTGAFFIAVLEKKSEIRAKPEASNNSAPIKHAPAPISAIIDELDSKKNEDDPSERITAADSIVPSTIEGQVDNTTPAMLQNEEPEAMDEDGSEKKRKLEEGTDAPNKRLALTEDPGSPTDEGRRVHYPPPPGAALGLTAHDKTDANSSLHQKKKTNQTFEEPFRYLDPDHEVIKDIFASYNINERFPRDRFLVRNATGNPSKKIYYTCPLAKEILIENEGKGFKFVHAGVTMFVRQDVHQEHVCRWRIQTDGLQIIEGWVGEARVLRLNSKRVLRELLIEMFPKLSGGGWIKLEDFGKQNKDIDMGCYVLRLEKGEGEDAFRERIVLPMWKNLHSLNLMLPKEDRKAMLLRLYNDDSPIRDSSRDRFTKNQEEKRDSSDDIEASDDTLEKAGEADAGDIQNESSDAPKIANSQGGEDEGSDFLRGG